MFPDLRRSPASIPFFAIVCGLVISPYLISGMLAASALAIAGVLCFAVRSRSFRTFAILLLALSSGILAGENRNRDRTDALALVRSLPSDRFVEVRATVDNEWIESRDGVRTRVDRFELISNDRSALVNEPLSIYAPVNAPAIDQSDRIIAEGIIRESRNGRLYLSVKSARLIRLESTRPRWHPRRWNRAARAQLERHVRAFPEHARASSLIRAIALGDGSSLSIEMKESFRQGGTYHLLVFSGMQIAFAAALAAALLYLLRLRRATDAALIALAVLAPLFAGFEPSVGRASTMIGVFGISRLMGRPTPTENLLYLSASLRLLCCPDELVSPGFLLTYGATFGLIVVGKTVAANVSRPGAMALAFGFGAELCAQPLTLIFFRHYVAGGFVITLLLAPVLSGILLLSIPIALALWAGSDLAWPLIEIVARLDHLAVLVNDLAAHLRLSGIAPRPDPVVVLVCFAIVWAISISKLTGPWKAIGMTLVLGSIPVSVWIAKSHMADEGPYVEFLDVGQGDSILIRAGETILIDGGGSANDPEFGRRTLIPLLADRGIDRLDVVVISHPDIDHCGGLLPLAGTVRIDEIWMSPRHVRERCAAELLDRAPDARARFLRDGEQITRGGIDLTVTIPRLRYKKNPLNNGSVVLTGTISTRRVVLTGDMESDAELTIAEEAAERLRGEILKVPHHGSHSSSSPELLGAVRPRIAVISCELDNIYGHPSAEVLERLKRRSIHVWRTDQSGSIRIAPVEGRLRIDSDDGRYYLPFE